MAMGDGSMSKGVGLGRRREGTRVALGTVLLVLAMVVAVDRAQGAYPGENGKIAFDSDRRGGDSDVWTMDPGGGNLVNLTAKSQDGSSDEGAKNSPEGVPGSAGLRGCRGSSRGRV